MSLKSAQHRLNGKYPMVPYILFFSLIIGFQFGFAMDVDQVEVGQEVNQDELDQQLVAAVQSYFDPNQQATVVDRVGDLLNRGANPNIAMDRLESPLLYLLIMRDRHENGPIKRRLMELLIRAGADPNCRIVEDGPAFARNSIPLSWSCAVENRAIFDLLVEHGADIRQHFGNNNGTLLHSAAACWNLELCEFLLREGFDVNAVNDNGNTPLHSVCNQFFAIARPMQNNGPAVIALLLDWGAQINLQNKREMTPLHLVVARNGSRASVRPPVALLLARGADLNLLCRWSDQNELRSPLELALKRKLSYKREYKEHRRLCELMITHQVFVNKGALTLLCSLRKMGLEGNGVANTLYRQRDQLLTPYLQQLYRPLEELLQRPETSRLGSPNLSRQIAIDLSEFRLYRTNFPKSNFNIDFLDPARITETYQNLNRNIYRGLHQPKVIGLTESNPVLNNTNNNEPHRKESLVGVPALVPNDFDSYDDYSDDDNNGSLILLMPNNRGLLAEEIRNEGFLTSNNLVLRAEEIHVDCEISMGNISARNLSGFKWESKK